MLTISHRINTSLLVLLVVMAGAIIAMLGTRAYGGPLDPPAAPGSTDGVREPGTPISSVPYAISQPGRYYITRDLTTAGGGAIAISITTGKVTLDLGGFTLQSPDTSGTGVSAVGPGKDYITLENGRLKGFATGVDLQVSAFSLASGIEITDFQSIGITIGPNSVIERCILSNGNGQIGAVLLGQRTTMRGCSITSIAGDGVVASGNSVIEDSLISAAGAVGGRYGILPLSSDVTIRNNFLDNGARDVGLQAQATGAIIIDNTIHCATSIVNLGVGNYIAPIGGEPHANVPRNAAGFC